MKSLRIAALLAATGLLAVACTSASPDGTSTSEANRGAETTATPEPPPPPPELPKGGREVFPDYRLVGYSGVPNDPALAIGRLTGDLDARCKEMKRIGKQYADGRKVLPVFELIATVVHPTPGEDGNYNSRQPNSVVRDYLKATRKCKGILLLNIQPGRSEFLPEMKHFERFLKEPDVGVALDPEWAMDPGRIPNKHLGRTDGAELNESAKYLSNLVAEHDLPEKVMVFHQFNFGAVEKVKKLKPQEGVALVRSIDGLGTRHAKEETYDALMKDNPKYIHAGFKLFYQEDTRPPHAPTGAPLMTPKQVMALRPQPEYILYE